MYVNCDIDCSGNGQNYSYDLGRKQEDKRFRTEWQQESLEYTVFISLFLSAVLICQCLCRVSDLRTIVKAFIICLCAVTLSQILLTRHELYLLFPLFPCRPVSVLLPNKCALFFVIVCMFSSNKLKSSAKRKSCVFCF